MNEEKQRLFNEFLYAAGTWKRRRRILVKAEVNPLGSNTREVVGGNSFPVSAGDICTALKRSISINRVSVYRILDLLVDHGLVERISTGGRSTKSWLALMEFVKTV